MDFYNMTYFTEEGTALLSNFSITEAQSVATTLAIYVFALAIYSIFIFKFYRFLAKRDIFTLDLSKYRKTTHAHLKRFFSALYYIFKYLFVFPLVVFLWFAFLGLLLLFLSKGGNVEQVLLIAISLVGAVRVTAYYNEDLARDLSKMLPFALLGIFLVDASYFDLSNSIAVLYTLPDYWKLLTYYFIFIIDLEFILRIITGIGRKIRPGKQKVQDMGQQETQQQTQQPSPEA